MGIVQVILIAAGLAMDACAVSICKGLKMKRIDYKYTLLIASFFGGFQALMPLLGWSLGKQFEKYITSFDHWIAFFLLIFIGWNMLHEAYKNEEDKSEITYNLKEVILMSIATSIDALAVGITFAFLKTDILLPVILIGLITFAMSFAGVLFGNRFGMKYRNKAEYAGGIILILIGTRILLEHLNVI